MLSLRRAYHRRFGYHTRLHVAMVVTIAAVSFVLVPHLARLLDSFTGYNPVFYEPKDAQRQEWLTRQESGEFLPGIGWDVALNVLIFVVVAVVWLSLVPMRSPRRPSGRR